MLGLRLASRGARKTYISDEFPDHLGWSMGFVAGTKVATPSGWTKVEDLHCGDFAFTFDEGPVRISNLRFSADWQGSEMRQDGGWVLDVPAGVIGNREALKLLPGQAVMIESDVAEETLGDPFVVIPAKALLADPRVSRSYLTSPPRLVQIFFESEQVVFAGGGLVLCPQSADLLMSVINPHYQILSQDRAEALVALGSAPTYRANIA